MNRHIITYIPTFEAVKSGQFIHFVTTEGPTMVEAEGKVWNFRQLTRCLNNAFLGRIYGTFIGSLIFWQENKYLRRPKVELYINCRYRIIVIEVIKESKIMFERHTDVC